MSYFECLNGYLSEFGKKWNLGELAFDGEDMATIASGDVFVNLHWREAICTLVVWAPVGVPADEEALRVWREALKANLHGRRTDGFSLALATGGEIDGRVLVLQDHREAEFFDCYESFESYIASLIRTVGVWRGQLVTPPACELISV